MQCIHLHNVELTFAFALFFSPSPDLLVKISTAMNVDVAREYNGVFIMHTIGPFHTAKLLSADT